MAAAFVIFLALHVAAMNAATTPSRDSRWMLVTAAVSTVVWLVVTFPDPAGVAEQLDAFYRRVRPGGPGWRGCPLGSASGTSRSQAALSWVNWLAGVVAVYAAVFGVGALLTGSGTAGAAYLAVAVAAFALIQRNLRRDPQLAAHVDSPPAGA